MSVNPIPEQYGSLTPYLIVQGAPEALDFYTRAFGAEELMRMEDPANGKIGHAEMRIGNSVFMMADEVPNMGFLSPKHFGGSPVSFLIYVEDVDAVFNQAIAAGAKELKAVKDQFYGDRSGQLEDPFGHVWSIASHIEDVTMEQVEERMKQGACEG